MTIPRQCNRPYRLDLVSTNWIEVHVDRPCMFRPANPATWTGTEFFYVFGRPGINAVARNEYHISQGGCGFLGVEGDWYIYTAGAVEAIVVTDAQGSDNSAAAAAFTGASSGDVNLRQIFGTNQTALDLTARYAPLTAAAPDVQIAGAASGPIVVGLATRRGLVLTNLTAGSHVYLGFGASDGVIGRGICLMPFVPWGWNEPSDGRITAVVNAIADVAAANVGIQSFT